MIEVLKQALDALETEVSIDWTNNDEFNASAEKMHDAITSLRQAIAEAEKQQTLAPRCMGTNCRMPNADSHSPECIWETAQSQGWSNAPEAIEARQAIAEAEKQEPVAWMYDDDYQRMLTSETFCKVWSLEVGSAERGVTTVPLYTYPPQRTEQEPVAWSISPAVKGEDGRLYAYTNEKEWALSLVSKGYEIRPLVHGDTHPPQRTEEKNT